MGDKSGDIHIIRLGNGKTVEIEPEGMALPKAMIMMATKIFK